MLAFDELGKLVAFIRFLNCLCLCGYGGKKEVVEVVETPILTDLQRCL